MEEGKGLVLIKNRRIFLAAHDPMFGGPPILAGRVPSSFLTSIPLLSIPIPSGPGNSGGMSAFDEPQSSHTQGALEGTAASSEAPKPGDEGQPGRDQAPFIAALPEDLRCSWGLWEEAEQEARAKWDTFRDHWERKCF